MSANSASLYSSCMARKELRNIAYVPNWLSAAGALAGVLPALGVEVRPPPYLTGISGHAFQTALVAGPQGAPRPAPPTGSSYRRAVAHYAALGLGAELLEVRPGDERSRQAAFERIRRSIDRKRPVIAFGLHLPEFGIVRGYGDGPTHLLVSTLVAEQHGPTLPLALWPPPGATDPAPVALLERRGKFDSRRAEQAALRFAVAEADATAGDGELACGLAAYERWRDLLLSPGAEIDRRGNAYTVQATLAARREAAQFLDEIADHHPSEAALREAAAAYRAETLDLSRMSSLFVYPHGGDIDNPRAREQGARHLEAALGNERTAVDALRSAISRMT